MIGQRNSDPHPASPRKAAYPLALAMKGYDFFNRQLEKLKSRVIDSKQSTNNFSIANPTPCLESARFPGFPKWNWPGTAKLRNVARSLRGLCLPVLLGPRRPELARDTLASEEASYMKCPLLNEGFHAAQPTGSRLAAHNFYSSLDPSRNRRNLMKTNGRHHFYSSQIWGVDLRRERVLKSGNRLALTRPGGSPRIEIRFTGRGTESFP